MSEKLNRRAILAGAAAVPALAVPAIAAPASLDQAATVARAQQIVNVLGGRYVCQGWNEAFDKERAAKFLKAVRDEDYTADNDPAEAAVSAWMHDHNQSFDWLYGGDPRGMICGAASQSPAAAAIIAPIDIRERRLFEIEKEIRGLELKIKAAGDAWSAAEDLAMDWDGENPMPIRPDFPDSWVGWQERVARVLKDGGTDGDALRAIMGVDESECAKQKAEHAEAVAQWEMRRAAARDEMGHSKAKNNYEGLLDDQDMLFEEAAGIPAVTLSGIHCKARLARAWDPGCASQPTVLAGSLVADLLAIQGVQS